MDTLDMFRLEKKTALVTGCTRGIGKAMAFGLAGEQEPILLVFQLHSRLAPLWKKRYLKQVENSSHFSAISATGMICTVSSLK